MNILACKHHDSNDVPSSIELDWLDDLHSILDAVETSRLSEVHSIAELALVIALNGFAHDDKEMSDGAIWYGLVSWIFHLYLKADELQVESDKFFDAVGSKDAATSMMFYKRAQALYAQEVIGVQIVFECILEFANSAQEVKDPIFELLARMHGSSKKADTFIDVFMQKLTKSVIPENDIPDV